MPAQITGLDDKDIVFVRFEGEGGPHCLPYFICLDHEKESVVVSIRGTLSIEVRHLAQQIVCVWSGAHAWCRDQLHPTACHMCRPAQYQTGYASCKLESGILRQSAIRALVTDTVCVCRTR